jgi:hypothetical protein
MYKNYAWLTLALCGSAVTGCSESTSTQVDAVQGKQVWALAELRAAQLIAQENLKQVAEEFGKQNPVSKRLAELSTYARGPVIGTLYLEARLHGVTIWLTKEQNATTGTSIILKTFLDVPWNTLSKTTSPLLRDWLAQHVKELHTNSTKHLDEYTIAVADRILPEETNYILTTVLPIEIMDYIVAQQNNR